MLREAETFFGQDHAALLRQHILHLAGKSAEEVDNPPAIAAPPPPPLLPSAISRFVPRAIVDSDDNLGKSTMSLLDLFVSTSSLSVWRVCSLSY